MSDATQQPSPMLPPGPVPVDETHVSLEKPAAHPLIPGEAPPAWAQPGPDWSQQGQAGWQTPPPGWVGTWHPPVPPTPTDDPSTWPQMGVAPGAGPHVGSWAVAHHEVAHHEVTHRDVAHNDGMPDARR